MLLNRKEIGKDIYLSYVHETKFKTNIIQVNFIQPLKKETAASNALVFQVISRGTEHYPTMLDIKKTCEDSYDLSIGCGISKYGDNQVITLTSSMIDRKYTFDDYDTNAKAIEMIGEYLFHPLFIDGQFKNEYVDDVRQKAIDREKEVLNNKGLYASIRCLKSMMKDDPFAISGNGEIEDLEKCTNDDIKEAYKRILETSKIEIFAVGSFDYDNLYSSFTSMFSGLSRHDIHNIVNKPFVKLDECEKVYEHMDVNQGKLSLGFSIDIDDYKKQVYASKILNGIFGGGTLSKLFMNVREKLSLCYYCSSSENTLKGYFQVNSGVEFENEKKAYNEIMHQLSLIQNGEITDDEITAAKEEILNGLRSVGDNCGSIAGWYFACILKNEVLTPKEVMEKYLSVTKEEVVDLSKKLNLCMYYFLCGKEK